MIVYWHHDMPEFDRPDISEMEVSRHPKGGLDIEGFRALNHDGRFRSATCINLETGEVLQGQSTIFSSGRMPEWVTNPLLRALRVAQFKERMGIK